MNYSELRINFEKPKIWRRPSVEKLPDKGKPYSEVLEEQKDFEKAREGVKTEITNVVNRNMDASKDINDINRRLGEICDFYGKAIIPSEDVDKGFLLARTNKNTLNKKLQGWCKNIQYNIPEIIDSKPYDDIRDKFKDVPAFICMAGPSLKNNREKLLKIKDKAIIIAVDTSLRPLLDIGVTPDICVTHDANPNGCKFFLSKDHALNKFDAKLNDKSETDLGLIYASLLKDEKRKEYKYDTLGLFVNYCHPLTLLAWNGREKRFYGVLDPSLPVYDVMASSSNYRMEDKKLIPENKGRVVGGSSVGHVATYVAIALGCKPISLLGLDLSYPGGKTYVEGASNQKDVSKQKLIEMNSLGGGKVKTNVSMLSYKMVFEQSFPHILQQMPHLQFFNTTCDKYGKPSGILEVGAEPRDIDSIIDEYCKKDIDKSILKRKNSV